MSLSPHHADVLLDIAKRSIRHGLDHKNALVVDSNSHEPALQQERSSFVTLHLEGKLRGCMGGLKARIPLIWSLYFAAAAQVGMDVAAGISEGQGHYIAPGAMFVEIRSIRDEISSFMAVARRRSRGDVSKISRP